MPLNLFHNSNVLRRGNGPRKPFRWFNLCEIELRQRERMLGVST